MDENYKGKFLFTIKDFESFGTDGQIMYFMLTRFLKDNINGARFPQPQLAHICDTTHPSHENLVKIFYDVHYMWWVNQYLKLQEWEDCIKLNKTRILAIIKLSPNNNSQGYKEQVISFIDFYSG